MIKGKTINELAALITKQQEEKKDYVASTALLEYRPEGGERGLIHFKSNGDEFNAEPTRHCLRQIGDRVGIPSRYLDRMATVVEGSPGSPLHGVEPVARVDHRPLLAHNINYWFHQQPETRMLRTLQNGQNTARAFLSDRYRPLDNHDLAEVVLPLLMDAGCEVLSSEITETRLYIQAATPRLELDLNALRTSGKKLSEIDPVQAGVVISNSEVGRGAINIELMLHRLRCFNGLVMGEGIKRHHVGRATGVFAELEQAAQYFTDATRQLDDRAFWAKVHDVVSSIFQLERFTSLAQKFAGTSAVALEIGPIKAVEEVTKQFRLADTEKASVLKHLVEGGDLSLFGLVNAVTRTAEDMTDYDRAIDFERMGGDIIELPASQWSKIS